MHGKSNQKIISLLNSKENVIINKSEPEEFLKRYLELAPDFENVLKSEFGIKL